MWPKVSGRLILYINVIWFYYVDFFCARTQSISWLLVSFLLFSVFLSISARFFSFCAWLGVCLFLLSLYFFLVLCLCLLVLCCLWELWENGHVGTPTPLCQLVVLFVLYILCLHFIVFCSLDVTFLIVVHCFFGRFGRLLSCCVSF